MDTGTLIMAYAAAATVAGIVTAAFAPAMDRVLYKLIPEEVAPAWSQFMKFALFVASFARGMPVVDGARFIDRTGPLVTPPAEGQGLMIVMKSVGGALAGASWTLLLFFGVTLTAFMAGRVWVALKERRDKEAAEIKAREDERREEKKKQDESAERRRRDETRDNMPPKRAEPADSRPVPPKTEPVKNPPAPRK